MEEPVRDVLDSDAPRSSSPLRARALGWAAGASAVALLGAGGVLLQPPADDDVVALRLVEHSGSALAGQSFVRVYFSVGASGGDAEVEQVEMVLGDRRQSVVAPERIGDGGEALVLVDVVPDCPDAVRGLAAGTLDVTYRSGGDAQVARLPLPVEGSLPRLVARSCRS